MSTKKGKAQKEEVVDNSEEEVKDDETEAGETETETEVEGPAPLELLGKVVDSQITGDDEVGGTAFHDYLQGKMKNVLNPEPAEADLEVDDSMDPEGSEDASTDEVTDEVKED